MYKYKLCKLLIVAIIFAIFPSCNDNEQINSSESSASEQKPVSGVLFAMDTFVEQTWYGENADTTFDMIAETISDIEISLSMYTEDTEVSRINENAGIEPVEISENIYNFLQKAKELSIAYSDYFDITIAPVTSLWNVNGETAKLPEENELKTALALVDADSLILSEDEGKYFAFLEHEGMAIDLGGIAKGYAAGLCMEIAVENNCTGFLSIGGNLGVIGKKPDGSDFRFGVRDPEGTQEEYVAVVTLEGYSMATTGAYERFFEVDGERYHHVFDPKTGYPANPELKSLTVISKDAALADCLSTAMFVAGKDYALSHLNNEEFALIIIDNDNVIHISPWYAENITLNEQNSAYKFAS